MADAEASTVARKGGCRELPIPHCASGYAAPAEDFKLHTFRDMIAGFGVVTGLSNQTLDNTTALASVSLGAELNDKQFTLDRSGGRPDHSFSLEPSELTALCQATRTAWSTLRLINYGRKSSKQGQVRFRRLLCFFKYPKTGDLITQKADRSVRPGYELPPRLLKTAIERRVTQDETENTVVTDNTFGGV